MFKRRLSGKMLAMLGVMLVALCVSAFAGLRDGSWEVNPAAFRYDMSLYFKLADEDYEDLDKYEIGAFVGDECRGLAEKLELPDGKSCLYMRIRSNEADGELVDFLLRNKETADTVVLRAKDGSEFPFVADSRVGMPSEPLVMERCYNVAVSVEGRGEVDFVNGLYAAGTQISLNAVPAEGYHFEGWSNGSTEENLSFTLDSNVELTAKFSPNVYNVVFNLDGVEFAVLEVPFEAAIEAPEVPARVGYSFSGWEGLPEVMPAHDVVVSGSFTVNTYKLVFKIDNEVVSSEDVEYDSPVVAPEAPEKEGYTFNGWVDVPATMPAHDVEIHSSYTVNSYLLTFELDGETIFSEEIAYGTAIVAPETPAREGYTFSGWSELPATMPAADLTVKGEYTVNSYKLIFKIDGEEISAEDVEFGAPVVAPEAPEKIGYTFNGWGELPETMPSHDVEMHSSYTVNYYKLSFKLDGEVILSDSLVYGASIVAPEVAEKIGHTFSGWGEVPETMPAEDVEFSGVYEVNIYNVTYKVDGEVAYHAEVEYGAPVPTFDPAEKDGYTFSGWGLDIPAVMPAKDLEFNGNYIVNLFAITFRIGGDVINSDRLPYGAEIVAPEAPAKEGYTFTGWKDVPATMPAQDVVIDGDYKVNTYTVTFRIDNEDFLVAEYEYGAPIEAPEAPSQEGHSFSGWGDVPATMPAFDLVFGGTYAENFYTVTFRIDGVVLFTDDVEFDTPISVPEAPEKEGHTFNGWGEVPATMPAYNLEYDGSYSVNSYAVSFRIGDEVIYSGTLPYGAEIVAPEAPAKDGYSFSGWGIVPATMPASDLELTGEYSINSYILTFRIDDADFFTTQLEYGAAIEAPEAPSREGYSFSGWNGLLETMPANDLVVSGTYSVNNFKLVFRIGDEVVFEGELAYGTEIVAPEAPVKEGHTFAGWGMVPATMPATDLELNGSYDVNVYNLTYRIDDVDFFTTQMAYGSEITAPEAPAKEGHSFLGWSENVTVMPASDLVISGTYSINSYNLVFKIGDEVVFEGLMPYGSEIVVPEGPAKDGHTFAGWGMVPATMPATDLEFNGSYDLNVYTITFDIDGEVFYQTQLAYGTEIVAPAEVPDKEGKTFRGWGDVPATMPANDLTVSGTYDVNNYTLTFRIGEEVIFTGQQPYGSDIVAPEVADKEGYLFSGWADVPTVMPAHNVEIVGEWIANRYDLIFMIDGEVVASADMAYGEPIVVPEVEEKEGHTFAGWGVVPATMPASDLILTGTYEVNSYNVVFRIGEEVVYSTMIPYGSEIVAPEAPAKEGYTFAGWGEVPASMPAKDLVFDGNYSANEYVLTFSIDGEVIFSGKMEYGAEVVAPEAPEKEGHTFMGWGVVPATMPASDLEITGLYEVNTYSAVFILGGEVFYTAQIPYGAEVVAPEVPEKEGHSFGGWGQVPSVMPASDLDFSGDYTVNSYKVVFRIGDQVISESLVSFGAEIPVPDAPAKEGHSFGGWGIVPAVMPASDLEFSGVYDVNYYNVVFMINEDVVFSAQLPYGAEIVAPAVAENEGFSFSGWSEYPATVPAYDVLVTGSYAANYYTLTVYINDEVYMTESVQFGAELNIPDPEVKDGQKFDGWDIEIPATMPAHDLEIHGTISNIAVGVAGIAADQDVTIFSVDGVLLYKDVKASDIKERLTPGVYIINGRKMIVR